MAEFSSCYFCGAALDAPLDEYPVVPAELHPSPKHQGTVVLCPTCQEKLDKVIDTVVESVETESQIEAHARTDATTEGVSKETPTTDEELTVDSDAEWTPPGDEGDVVGTDGTGDPSTEKRTTPTGETDDQSPIFENDSSTASDTSDPYDPVFDDDQKQSTSDQDDDTKADDGREGSTAEAESASASTGGATKSTESIPDPQTYNRVVRLLQNRDFPVDRAEIEAVATNAYELSPGEFDGVIRLAVDRGVLEEEDGQLVLPGSN
jgi:hypothetical protein